jgi:hypothetical protein
MLRFEFSEIFVATGGIEVPAAFGTDLATPNLSPYFL